MPTIPLSNGAVAIVDDVDYEWAASLRWSVSANNRGRVGYAARGGSTDGKPWLRYLHREVAIRAGILDPDSDHQVDHVNRNSLDNRRANLRAADRSINASNVAATTASGLLGVYEDKRNGRSGRWYVEVRRRGTKTRKWGFTSPEEAAAWRQEFVETHFGY